MRRLVLVFSYSWGAAADPGSGKTVLSSINLQQEFDRSVPPLETFAETGKTISSVVLTEVDASGNKLHTIVLTNAHVSSVSVGSAVGAAASASLVFSYDQEAQTDYYYPSAGSVQTYKSCWNVVLNKTC